MASKECVDVNEFNIKHFSITPLTDSMLMQQKKDKFKQYTTFVHYYEKNLHFKSGNIKITEGGIPPVKNTKTGDVYYKDPEDSTRAVIRLPIDTNQESCIELYNMLHSIDEYIEKHKKEILPAINHEKIKLEYYPLCKPIKEKFNEQGELIESKYNKYGRINIKLASDFQTKEITTKVYIKDGNKIKPVKIKSIADVEKYVKWDSTIKFIGIIPRIWVSQTEMFTKGRGYGLKLICEQIIITKQREGSDFGKEFFGFADEGELDENAEIKEDKKEKIVENEEDDDSDDGDDSEDEKKKDVKIEPPKYVSVLKVDPKSEISKKTSKSKVIEEEEEDSDDDIDEKIKKSFAKSKEIKLKSKVIQKKEEKIDSDSDSDIDDVDFDDSDDEKDKIDSDESEKEEPKIVKKSIIKKKK